MVAGLRERVWERACCCKPGNLETWRTSGRTSASFGACSRARGAIADKAAGPGALGDFFQLSNGRTSAASTQICLDNFLKTISVQR